MRRLPDATPEAEQAQRKELVAFGERLGGIDARQLSGESALNHTLLTRIVKESIEEAGFDFGRIAFQNDSGFHTLADYVGRTTTIASREDADAWLARLEALPTYYEQNVANLKRGIKTRYTQPRIVVDRVLQVARKQVEVKPEDSSLLLPFARMPASIPGRDASRISQQGARDRSRQDLSRAARVRRVHGARVRAGGAAGAGLAHDAGRRGELSVSGARADHHGHDARPDPQARAGGSRAHSRPDGEGDRRDRTSRAASPSS